jgi:hypothetical protein
MDSRDVVSLLDPRTPIRLALARSPRHLADYYWYGADYVQTVATAMDFPVGDLEETVGRARAAMAADETDVRPAVARSIASVLLGDANWWLPLGTWVPPRYALLSGYRAWPLFVHLRRVGHQYARNLDSFSVPAFSTRWDVLLDGRTAASLVDGYRDRIVLADSILHLEWFVAVAADHGIEVPEALVERTREESIRYFTGRQDTLPPDVREFQYHLFADGDWIRRFADRYTGRTVIDDMGIDAIEAVRNELASELSESG